jgi:glutaredoxin
MFSIMSPLRLTFALLLLSCGNPASREAGESPERAIEQVPAGRAAQPPFAVTGEAEGLLLVWYDASGPHVAERRSDIPEASRAAVRVDSLAVAPEKRLDAEHVYVADLRAPTQGGSYRIEIWERTRFEAQVAPRGEVPDVAPVAAADVTIYGASWCGACAQAKQFLQSRGVPFVEKDIEKDPGARAEMLSKARAQGVRTGGIPILDVHGKILPGFDPRAVLQALSKGS